MLIADNFIILLCTFYLIVIGVSQYQDDGPNKKPADEIEGNSYISNPGQGGGLGGWEQRES